jgi:hypothetical protein
LISKAMDETAAQVARIEMTFFGMAADAWRVQSRQPPAPQDAQQRTPSRWWPWRRAAGWPGKPVIFSVVFSMVFSIMVLDRGEPDDLEADEARMHPLPLPKKHRAEHLRFNCSLERRANQAVYLEPSPVI